MKWLLGFEPLSAKGFQSLVNFLEFEINIDVDQSKTTLLLHYSIHDDDEVRRDGFRKQVVLHVLDSSIEFVDFCKHRLFEGLHLLGLCRLHDLLELVHQGVKVENIDFAVIVEIIDPESHPD